MTRKGIFSGTDATSGKKFLGIYLFPLRKADGKSGDVNYRKREPDPEHVCCRYRSAILQGIIAYAPPVHDDTHIIKEGRDAGVWHGLTEGHTKIHNRGSKTRIWIKGLTGSENLPARATLEPFYFYMNRPRLISYYHNSKLFFFDIVPGGFSSAIRTTAATVIKKNILKSNEGCSHKV